MKKLNLIIIVSLLLQFLAPVSTQAAGTDGLILLAVQGKGEAWYANPLDGRRYSLGRPAEALATVKKLGLGINNQTYAGLSRSVPTRLLGRILINVEDSGKAYFVNPRDRKLYYLGNPVLMLSVMRRVGVGITNADLAKIPVASAAAVATPAPAASASTQYLSIEKAIQELVNDQREQNGLTRLKWNDELAAVAREHSQNQADENRSLISQNKLCSYPFIHHEGQVFGLYHADRLTTKKVHYQSASAENIALIPKIRAVKYDADGIAERDCQAEIGDLNAAYEAEVKSLSGEQAKVGRLKSEIARRASLVGQAPSIKVVESLYNTTAEVQSKAVTGWMNSPGHRHNILNGDYDEAGMGVAEVNGYYIITQVFIKRATCGFLGGTCCEQSGFLPFCYIPWSCSESKICQ